MRAALIVLGGVAAGVSAAHAPAQEVPESPALSSEALRTGVFTRCGHKTVTRPTGYEERTALCVWTDKAGNAFLISVQVQCDDQCRPVGEPYVTAFYE